MIALSMHQLTIQITIVQRNINLPNHDLARLLKFKQHYITANHTISSAFTIE